MLRTCSGRSRNLVIALGALVSGAAYGQDARENVIVDANILTPYRLTLDDADIRERNGIGEFDVVRAQEGGLDIAVMGMLIPTSHQEKGDAKEVADARIDEWLALIESSEALELIGDVRDATRRTKGRVGILLALENGAPLGSELKNVGYFYDRGVRLITLVHSRPNHIGDSSYAQHRPWKGLSPIGRDIVLEMNRLGMIIDVSHIGDDTFDEVLDTSTAPVIASHSSCRSFTPGWERNLDDARIERLAENGGVLHVTFGGSFLSTELMIREQPVWDHVEGQGLSINSIEGRSQAQSFRQERDIAYATIGDVVDHIDHVVKLVGIDHVGIGSGFDGSGDSMPNGLKDVSDYQTLIDELVDRRYSKEDVEKILSGNFLRVWRLVEAVASERENE